MPIYEYQCESCDKLTEAIQRLDEPVLTICPHCGGPLRKLMSAPSFQFKGTGWYVTDYASKKGDGKGGSEEATSGSGGDGATTEKSESGAKSDSSSSTSSS